MRAQELYNHYCKKEISIQDFLYQVRRDPLLKEYISPVNSVEDVVLILKQRAGITEQITNEDLIIQEKEVEGEDGESLPLSPEFGEEIGEYADDDKEKYDNIDSKYGTDEVRDVLEANDLLGFDLPGEAMNAILTHNDWNQRWEVSDAADINVINTWKKSVIDKAKASKQNRLQEAAKKKKLTADDVIYSEYHKGWKWEYENSPKLQADQNIEKAKEIALKNLAKDPIYYTNQLIKITDDRMKKAPKETKEKILKAPTDQVELKDKANQMKNVKKDNTNKSNVKTNLSKQEKAKGMPKGVKVMKLKESIRKELKELLTENNAHIEAMRDMVKMKPEDLAKQVLDNKLPMTAMRSEFAAQVLGKHIADGNKSSEVVKAFHQLNDKLNESLNEKTTIGDFETWKKSVIPLLSTALKTDDKAAEKIFNHYHKTFDANHKSGQDAKTAVKAFAKGLKKIKEDSFEKSASGNVFRKFLGKTQGEDINDVAKQLLDKYKNKNKAIEYITAVMNSPAYKNDSKEQYFWKNVIHKIEKGISENYSQSNREKDFVKIAADALLKPGGKGDALHRLDKMLGKSTDEKQKTWLQKVKAHIDGIKEEYQDNTVPEKTDYQDTEFDNIEEKKKTVSKVHPVEGKMHKFLGLKPEESIASKFKSGQQLYNALSRKIKDHSKLTGMLAYAANINKQKDVFDAALHYAKKLNWKKKDV